jgi:hypothetical protein
MGYGANRLHKPSALHHHAVVTIAAYCMKQVDELFVGMSIKDERAAAAIGAPLPGRRSASGPKRGREILAIGIGAIYRIASLSHGSHDWDQAGSSKPWKCLHGR